VRELLRDFGDVRYVWRHLPLNDVHPNAQLAAEAAEAAPSRARSGRCTTSCSRTRTRSASTTSIGYARARARRRALRERPAHTRRRATSPRTSTAADLSGVSGTPTFFINGHRHYGAYDIATLSAAVKAARARELAASCLERLHDVEERQHALGEQGRGGWVVVRSDESAKRCSSPG
jgi:hypothetical protein